MFYNKIIERGFKKRSPWITNFTINGKQYGGDYKPEEDCRLRWFCENFEDAKTILDLGCLEGAQSFFLLKKLAIERIVGLEGRELNIQKAEYIKKILKIRNIDFYKLDVENEGLQKFGHFDVILCLGILYHLQKPWKLIKKMSQISDNAFIWTHYAEDDKASSKINSYQYFEYQELGLQDPQSGLSKTSIWPTFDCLLDMIRANGFPEIQVIEKNPNTKHGPVTTIIARKSIAKLN